MTDKTAIEIVSAIMKSAHRVVSMDDATARRTIIDSAALIQSYGDARERAGFERAKEKARALSKSAWLTASCGTIGDADYGNELCGYIADGISAMKDTP